MSKETTTSEDTLIRILMRRDEHLSFDDALIKVRDGVIRLYKDTVGFEERREQSKQDQDQRDANQDYYARGCR